MPRKLHIMFVILVLLSLSLAPNARGDLTLVSAIGRVYAEFEGDFDVQNGVGPFQDLAAEAKWTDDLGESHQVNSWLSWAFNPPGEPFEIRAEVDGINLSNQGPGLSGFVSVEGSWRFVTGNQPEHFEATMAYLQDYVSLYDETEGSYVFDHVSPLGPLSGFLEPNHVYSLEVDFLNTGEATVFDFSLTNTIPAPGAAALGCLGLAMVSRICRRRMT